MSSLMGMIYMGTSGIFASQVGLEVTGNNLNNMKSEGYSRQTAHFVSNKPQYTYVGAMGRGVKTAGVSRSYDELLAKSVRTEASAYSYFNSMQGTLKESMLYFNELEAGSGLGDSLKNYYNAWQSLGSTSPDDTDDASVKRLTLISNTTILTSKIREGYESIEAVRNKADSTLKTDVEDVNRMLKSVAELNKNIAATEFAGHSANDMRDARDLLVNRLSEKVNVSTYEREDGQIALFIAGQAMVDNGMAHELQLQSNPANENHLDLYWKSATPGSTPNKIQSGITGGTMAAAIQTRDGVLKDYMAELDNLAKTIITSTNKVHASGQGLERFTSISSSNGPLNPEYSFSSEPGKLPYDLKTGTFRISVYSTTDAGTPNEKVTETPFDIQIDAEHDTMLSVIDKINSVSGGQITASLSENNTLQISAHNGDTLAFGDDTSNFLVAAGINSFFSGTSAKDIDIAEMVRQNPNYIATGKTGKAGDNTNAKALADLQNEKIAGKSNVTVGEFYGYFIGKVGADKNQVDIFAATKKMSFTQLNTRLESVKGVVEGEELINMSLFQRTFEANSRFINICDEMLNTIINGLGSGGR